MKLKKMILAGLLTGTVLSVPHVPVISAQESTKDESPYPKNGLSVEEAQELMDQGFYKNFRQWMKDAGFSPNIVDMVSEDDISRLSSNYLLEYGGEYDPRGVYFIAHDLLESIYEEKILYADQDESTEEVETDLPQPLTHEEAIEQTDSGFYDTYLSSLYYCGVTDEMLAQLPEGAVHDAAIDFLTGRVLWGDVLEPYRHFITLYPEVVRMQEENNTTLEDLTDEEREALAAQSMERQEKLKTHNDNKEAIQAYEAGELQEMPEAYAFETKMGQYKVDYKALLKPEEAGNRSEDHDMLVLKITYENTTGKDHTMYVHDFHDHTLVTQYYEDESHPLAVALYQLTEEATAPRTLEPVAAGEAITFNVYYQLDQEDAPIFATFIEGEDLADYNLEVETLLQYPRQSALYEGEAGEFFIFDFDTLYLLNPQADEEEAYAGVEGVTLADFGTYEVSQEVEHLLENVEETFQTSLQFENIQYRVSQEGHVEVLNDAGDVLLTLATEDTWESFELDGHTSFHLLP